VCIVNVPQSIVKKYKLFGIEQTTSGINRIKIMPPQFPVITVASSATKQILEAPMIADAVARKIEKMLPITSQRLSCGVVGLGAIGHAVASKLIRLGHLVNTYDCIPFEIKSLNGSVNYHNVNQLIDNSDYIFGCSGNDITKNYDFSFITADKYFISCSSHDGEFLSLINYIHQNHAYQNLDGNINCTFNNQVKVIVFKNGYPINFDGTGESVSARDIQLTRGLLLSGVLQAIKLNGKVPYNFQLYMLCPIMQQFAITNWIHYGSKEFIFHPALPKFSNVNWVIENSGGLLSHIEIKDHL
jgi:S-adenosylhomocysteine hydrolase